ncbi:MAG: NAD(P)-dependent alcohol dehydrogenase [Paracoccaceae bacterium]
MKAITYKEYGPPEVLELSEVAKPVPKDNEVLIKIHASTVSSGDWRARSLDLPRGFGVFGRLVFGLSGPRNSILGTELSGVIEAVGKTVSTLSVGDHVIAYPGFGGHAEYKAMPADGVIALKPDNLSFEEAAALSFGGITALEFLRDKGNIQSGEKVLVIGASGATGSSAVQLARHFGASVSGVCSTANLALVKSLGADKALDYTSEDFSKNGEVYDLIVDTTGTAPWSRCKGSLTKTGRLLVISGSLGDMLKAPFVSRKHGKKLISGVSMGSIENLKFLTDLVETGHFKPLVDRVYPLEQAVQAHAYVDTGRKKGSVVLSISS